MSGLIESLSSAARAMQAHSLGIETAGHNMANLNTPGYARRMVQLAEVPPGSGGGVRPQGTPALRDSFVDARFRRELPEATREAAIASGLTVVETAIGAAGTSLDRDLAAFFDAWSALAQEPASPTARDNVVRVADGLASSFGSLSTRLDRAAREADLQIHGSVDQLNALTAEVASLNAAIARATGADTEALQDRLGHTLDELAGLVNIRVLRHDDGTRDVTLGLGQALVAGERSFALEATAGPGGAQILLGDRDVTATMTGGRLAGYRHLRDTLIPAYRAQLDELAFAVATEVNALHQTGFDLTGAAGEAFFVPPTSRAGAAQAMAVSQRLLADSSRIAASATGTTGDNQIASALTGLRDQATVGGSTFTEAWGQIVYTVGRDSATALAHQRSRQDVADAVSRLRDSVSGVSLDEEAAALIRYQRAYEANAKFFTTVGETLDMLLQLV